LGRAVHVFTASGEGRDSDAPSWPLLVPLIRNAASQKNNRYFIIGKERFEDPFFGVPISVM
jgi:hypothetical protein